MKVTHALFASLLLFTTGPAFAQALNDPVIASPNPEALFTSKDPKLNRNKQTALKIVRNLLEANHWDEAPQYMTPRYIQHNPMAASGRDGVVHFFVDVLKRTPTPIPTKMKTKVVAVQAEGDYVTVSYVQEHPVPGDSSKTYTTAWFDMWRFVDGKADEHWDPATLAEKPAS